MSQIDNAIVTYIQLKQKLEAYVANPDQSLTPALVADPNNCQLGQWIEKAASQYLTLPELKGLCAAHAKVHEAAAEVIRKADAGQSVAYQLAFGAQSEFALASHALVMSLIAMENDRLLTAGELGRRPDCLSLGSLPWPVDVVQGRND